jgi:putative FmdB family regulatory protein
MPLYDYRCKKCGYTFEVLHKIAESGPSECPKCNHAEVGKIISAVHGKVELSGHELKAKIKEDAKKLKMESMTNEKVRANLVGEDKYQANVVTDDKIRKEAGKE